MVINSIQSFVCLVFKYSLIKVLNLLDLELFLELLIFHTFQKCEVDKSKHRTLFRSFKLANLFVNNLDSNE